MNGVQLMWEIRESRSEIVSKQRPDSSEGKSRFYDEIQSQ